MTASVKLHRGATKLLTHDSRSLRRGFNPGAPEYEVGLLTTRNQSSVSEVDIYLCSVGKNLKEGGFGLQYPGSCLVTEKNREKPQ
jgi:hypothetical protein